MIPGGRDIKVFTGTMDKDTEARYLGANNYRHLLNARSSVNTEGSFGAIEDVMGNVLVGNTFLTNGKNKVIGSYEDIAGQSCIYFVWNELGFHGIFRWFANRVGFPNGVIEKIYQVATPGAYDEFNPSPLNFQEGKLITGVNLVDDLLYWTDGFNSPKMINIVRANETSKKRKFNFYFNSVLFDQLITNLTHTIDLYINGTPTPVASVTWAEAGVTTSQQASVETMYNALIASPLSAFVTFTNNVNYVSAEMNGPGIYVFDWTNNAPLTPNFFSGVVVPENFYPDSTATPFSYPPASYQLFERIKYPPMCTPSAAFKTEGFGLFVANMLNVVLQNQAVPTNPPTAFNFFPFYYYSGIGSVTNDTLGLVTLGSNNIITPSSPTLYGVFNAFIENTQSYPITLNLSVQLSIGLQGWNGLTDPVGNALMFPPLNQSFVINLGVNTNTSTPPFPLQQIWQWDTSYVGEGKFDPLTFYNRIITTQITLQPGQRLGMYSTSSGIIGRFQGAISGTVLNASLSYSQSNTYPQYRAKYIYKDFQNSVYGAISPTAVSPSPKFSEVTIDYSDDRLKQPELACDIRKVVLAVSLDAGLTWNDFATLDQYQFIGILQQTYKYKDNEVLIQVPPAEAILQYHNVPRKSKSQEYISDRIFDGKLLTGYDKVNVDYDVAIRYENIFDQEFLVYQTQRPFASVTRWKRGWKGRLGVVYYDDADRKTAVCLDAINGEVEIPYYNDTNDLNAAYLTVSIKSKPPDWATKYHFVRSENLLTTNYLMWSADTIELVDDNDNVVAPSLAKYIRVKLDNIPYYTDKAYRGSEISYTYEAGDRIRFINNPAGIFYVNNDYFIAMVTGSSLYIVYDSSINPISGSLIEIYSPSKTTDKLLYYEFGECFAIETIVQNGINVKVHTGNVQNQSYPAAPAPVVPAVSDIKTGDVWYRSRDLYYNTTTVPTFTVKYISSTTPSEYTAEKYSNNSRPNTTDLLGEVKDDSAFLFSDEYLSGTEINGLSAVQPLNYVKLNTVYGALNKMQVVNNDVLKLIFGNSYQVSIYVNQGVIRQTQGAGNLISLSDEVAGNSHIIQRTLGTINAESVIVNDEGDMFGYDENEGVVWIASGNGLIQISDRGMKSVFKRYSNERKAVGGVSHTPAVYDLYHDEYIITLGRVVAGEDSLNVFEGVTIAYNKQKQGWTSYYSFVPEYYGRVRDYIVSFKDGELWKHDASPIAKNFYGAQYPRELTYVSNKDFPKVKDYKAISVNGIGLNSAPKIAIPPFQGYPQGMLSSLSERFFKVLEGIQYSNFQKDSLTPGFGGNLLRALANGRNLKGQTIEVTLRNTDTAKSSIYSSDIVYFYSEHS